MVRGSDWTHIRMVVRVDSRASLISSSGIYASLLIMDGRIIPNRIEVALFFSIRKLEYVFDSLSSVL